ncbi:MAG: hypothetical protein WAS36_05355 [Candidatus Saccharimonadales bacterium]
MTATSHEGDPTTGPNPHGPEGLDPGVVAAFQSGFMAGARAATGPAVADPEAARQREEDTQRVDSLLGRLGITGTNGVSTGDRDMLYEPVIFGDRDMGKEDPAELQLIRAQEKKDAMLQRTDDHMPLADAGHRFGLGMTTTAAERVYGQMPVPSPRKPQKSAGTRAHSAIQRARATWANRKQP